MSTVKIKTEPPAATATTAAAVDVKVKLEPSLSTGDIKLEQHTSDIDTKVESGSEAGSEDGDVKSESDDGDEDTDQDQATEAPKNRRQLICKHPGCGRSFKTASSLGTHRREHRLQTELYFHGKTYILTRQSLDDRWLCPIPDCTSTAKTVNTLRGHIRVVHGDSMGQQHQHKQQKTPYQVTKHGYSFLDVDDFYVNNIRCSYHNAIGVFICYECRLVPESLLTHLQQKHAYDDKSIGDSVLPESAANANVDPNINQHTNNPYLSSAISKPHWQQHPDIVQGWLCITSDCGYCSHTTNKKSDHKRKIHQGERVTMVPALVVLLVYGKLKNFYFLITRLDQANSTVATKGGRLNRHRLDYSHNGLNAQDENDDGVDQNETTEASSQRRQWKCEYLNCERSFNSGGQLGAHRREHQCETMINVKGHTFTLTRQTLDDRWACSFPNCEITFKTAQSSRGHLQNAHSTSLKQKRANNEDSDDQQRQPIVKKRQRIEFYLNLVDFYVSDTRCGYHIATGLFICHECRLVPDCLLTHLQQKHRYDKKSIDSAILPESVVNARADPNINQHISNPHLTAAIREPNKWHHPDIAQGWLCVTSNCGYYNCTKGSRNHHQYAKHRGEQISTVSALVLRLLYGKTSTSYFLITQVDKTTNSSIKPDNSMSQRNSVNYDDDGDELVLSDYGSDDDIH